MARRKSVLGILLGGSSRRSKKGFFGTLLAGQRATERRNSSHKGVMCGPGGSKKRK